MLIKITIFLCFATIVAIVLIAKHSKMQYKTKMLIKTIICLCIATISAVVLVAKHNKANEQLEICTAVTDGYVTMTTSHSNKYGANHATVRYEVDGHNYSVVKVKEGDYWGDEVIVHYEPGNPENAYAGDAPYGKYEVLKYAITFMFFGIAGIVNSCKMKTDK